MILKEITVHTGSPCKVIVGRDLLSGCGDLLRMSKYVRKDAEKIVLVTDSDVDSLYSDRLIGSLEAAGYKALKYVIPAGEASKNTSTYVELIEFLAENEVTRSDLVAALGGGVVGDMAGFAAATYLRGIDFIGIPTTLLAAVDSSVGGKTGVDLKAGKNLVGAFHQPCLVICDLDTLDSLPEETFTDGSAEVIKYGIILDEELFNHLREHGLKFDREYVIPRCIEIKRDVVEADEFDNGPRQLLNYGHTLAHAAELKSGFSLSHGRAVSAGMVYMAEAAAAADICSYECADLIGDAVRKFGLPAGFDCGADELFQYILRDKKRRGASISLVVPETIGRCIVKKLSLAEAKDFLIPAGPDSAGSETDGQSR